jgi:cysteine desulfurase
LQLTVGRFNKDDDIDRVLEAVPQVVERLRKLSPIYNPKR